MTFSLVPFIPLVILRECSGFNFFPYSVLLASLNVENYGHPRTISYDLILLVYYSKHSGSEHSILKVLYCGGAGFKTCKLSISSHMISK